MDTASELRQRVLTVSANPVAVNYILAAMKAKLTVARNLRIKGQAKQPDSTRCSENALSWPAEARNPRI